MYNFFTPDQHLATGEQGGPTGALSRAGADFLNGLLAGKRPCLLM
jgi:hypothetical protein